MSQSDDVAHGGIINNCSGPKTHNIQQQHAKSIYQSIKSLENISAFVSWVEQV